jgi:hypothetical protein
MWSRSGEQSPGVQKSDKTAAMLPLTNSAPPAAKGATVAGRGRRQVMMLLVVVVAIVIGAASCGSAGGHQASATTTTAGRSGTGARAITTSTIQSTSTSAAVTTATTAPPTTPPTLAPTTPLTLAPTTNPPVNDCQPADLSLTFNEESAGVGQVAAVLVLTNRGSVTCSMDGYLGLVMLNIQGTALPTQVVTGSGYLFTDPGPGLVTLAPGQAASAGIEWGDVPTSSDSSAGCPTSALLQVTPPNDTTSAVIPAAITACDLGKLSTTAVQSGAAGPST